MDYLTVYQTNLTLNAAALMQNKLWMHLLSAQTVCFIAPNIITCRNFVFKYEWNKVQNWIYNLSVKLIA